MSLSTLPSSRSAARPDAAADPLGALMLKQRPEVLASAAGHIAPYHTTEKISDPQAIAALLSSCSALTDEGDDDLIFELLYLETLLAAHPLKGQDLLDQLGELGEDVREGLLPPGVVDLALVRRRTRKLRQQMGAVAGRITAAMLVLLTSMPFMGQEAEAAKGNDHKSFQIASAPVVRVVDANSGAGVAGVQIKSMEEKLLGVTDATGQATLSDDYMETDLLSLEKDGYQMYLLDRSQLSSRNIVSMKPLKDGDSATALLQKAPTTPKVAANGHGASAIAPKPPTPPKAPQVKLPIKPKAPKTEAQVAAKPAEAAAAPKAPTVKAPAAHEHKAPELQAIAPKAPAEQQAAPKAPVVKAPAAQPATSAQQAVTKPAAPRAPMVAAHETQIEQAETTGVAVPKRVPMPKLDADSHDAAAPASSGDFYKVRAGDTLSTLAKRHLGSARRWPEIYAANRDKVRNPHWLQVGQVLTMPAATAKLAKAPRTAGHYVVKPGDSLSRIAGEVLGDVRQWHKLYTANRSHIRNPHVIYPGQRLVLPS